MLGIGDYVDSDFVKSLQLDIARNDYICSAPEIWTSSSPGLKADVYSLGMVMLEIFSLKWVGESLSRPVVCALFACVLTGCRHPTHG